MDKNVNERNRKTDIVIILKPKDGKTAKATSGMVDNRLFTGDNELHAIMDIQTCLWSLKFNSGLLPPVLKQQFTSITKLLNTITDYYDRRDVIISEVRD